MMIRKVGLLVFCLLPLSAEAQRGSGAPPVTTGPRITRGREEVDYRRMGAGTGSITISNKDIESLNPLKVLLDNKKDLALTDDQVTQFKSFDATLKTRNDTLFHQLDSLRKAMKPSTATPEVERLRVRGVRTSLVGVIRAIREHYDAVEPDAVGSLSESQQKAATELMDLHQQKAEAMLMEKLGGGRRGG